MTGNLRQHVEKYSVVAAPLTNLLRKNAFASKYARKSHMEWREDQEETFVRLKVVLSSPLVLVFASSMTLSPRKPMPALSEWERC